jgi:hypothetical protein
MKSASLGGAHLPAKNEGLGIRGAERLAITVALAALCPMGLFVLGWWTAGGLVLYEILPLSERAVAVAALASLGVGLVCNSLLLRRWVEGFYRVDWRWLVPAYLFGAAVAVAFMMGAPFFNIGWGMLAGVYVGRRQRHAAAGQAQLAQACTAVSYGTAAVTTLAALPIGWMALQEGVVVQTLHRWLGWSPTSIGRWPGMVLVLGLCLCLFMIQYAATQTAVRRAYAWTL